MKQEGDHCRERAERMLDCGGVPLEAGCSVSGEKVGRTHTDLGQ